MLLEKVTWKFFLQEGEEKITPENLFKVFNAWIPGSPEIFIDPADYFHVSDGVKCILAGHYVHLYWDDTDKRPGFMYSRVKPFDEPDDQGRLKSSLANAIGRTLDLQKAMPELKFANDQIQFGIRERSIATNHKDSREKWSPEVISFLSKYTGKASATFPSDSRRLLQLDLKFEAEVNWSNILDKLK